MTTILNPSKLPEDEEKIRKILRELREKNVNMEQNISKLENILQDPTFQNITGKLYMCSNLNPNNNEDDQLIRKIGRCRQIIAPKIENLLKSHQHLVFLSVNPHQQNPEIYFQSSLDANGNSVGFSLAHYVIVGPKSFKKRPKNWLRIGDRIISVDYSLISELVIDSTHESAKQLFISKNCLDQSNNFKIKPGLLEQSGNFPIFGVIRDKLDAHSMALTGDWTQIQVVHLPNDPTIGLGFGIVGGASTGVVVKTILPGSAADKDGRLRSGDRILQIGRINVNGMSSQQVAGLLRQPEPIVELIVGRPINVTDTVADSLSCWTMATRAALNPTSLEEHIQQRINSMQNGNLRKDSHPKTPLTTVINCEFKTNIENNNDENENQIQEEIKPSTSQTSNLDKKIDDIKKRPDSTDSKSKSRSTSTDKPISLKNLQEMALTTFLQENWVDGQYEQIEVELHRDPHTGLGITVAGYVHKKEEINGVFVKSLVPNSSAHLSNKIRVHDLIISVNGSSLENLSHSQSVKTLVKSGNRVLLKMIRFSIDSPQAICLKMLHEQETDTQIVDVQSTLLDYKHYWQTKLGPDYEVISVIIKPDKNDMDGGLGLSLEGTVDVIDGTQLCPHHYIESLRKDGPAAKTGLLKSGDELLQVNDQVLYGESHITVRQALSKAAANAEQKDVRLTLSRKAQQINLYMPSSEQSLPLAYSLLATIDDRIVKAKSESTLNSDKYHETGYFLKEVSRKLKSRSLEHLSGLAIWNCVPIVVTLEKDSRGLGFSVIDYQDPLHPNETVIVIRALVPGGVAQADGRIVPGDRLLFVNSTDLSRATLEKAVTVLKATPSGLIRLGIAKPVPVDQLHFGTHSPIISRSERLLAKGTSPRSRRRRPKLTSAGVSGASSQEEVWIGADLYRKLNPQSHCSMLTWSPCSSRSLSPCGSPVLQGSWGYDVIYLPKNLERSIKLMKGALALGIIVDAELDKGINGCVVKSICSKKAIGRDGRVQVGDYLIKINTENLRNVTNSQAKAILKRTNFIGTQCNVTYITAADARLWKQHFHRETEQDQPVINRLSPKVFPKFYKSPYLDRKQSNEIKQRMMSESSFDDDENPKINDSTIKIAEEFGKKKAESIIDGIFIENFVQDLIQNALNDCYLELAVAEKVADWKTTTTKTSESLKETKNVFNSVSSLKSGPIQKLDEKQLKTFEVKNSVEFPEEELPPLPLLPKITTPVEPIFEPIPSTSKMVAVSEECQTNLTKLTPTQVEPQPKQKKKTNFWGEARTILLHREPGETFGISIVGGRVEVSQKGGLPGTGNTVTGIFIKSVMPDSPAGRSGKMFMGDRVISVNDVDLKDATHEYAVQVIKSASNPVKFIVQSLQSFSAHQLAKNDRQKIEIVHHTKETAPMKESVSFKEEHVSMKDKGTSSFKESMPIKEEQLLPSKESVPSKFEEKIEKPKEDERHVRMAEDEEHKPVTAQASTSSARESVKKRRFNRLRESMRKKLDESSAAALPKNSDDLEEEDKFCYTHDKIYRRYGDLPGEPILIKLENIPPKGLGLSLAGNRDREKNSVFVVDIKSTSPLPLKVGDELLEINGKVLFGLSHVTATSKIRECCEGDELALLILRRIDAIDEMATNRQRTSVLTKKDETEGPALASVSALADLSQVKEKEKIVETNLSTNLQSENIESTANSTTTATTAAPNLSSNNSDGAVPRKKSTTQQMEKIIPIETGKETWIEIDKDGKGLGLSIVGGSDTVLGTVVVHEVYSDGAAAVDGRLKPGDQLLEVNGSSLRDVSHEQAISILRRTPPKVKLLVYRDVNLQMSLLDPTQIYNIFTIELSKKPGRGLGLSIVGRKNEPGVYVSEIVKGGVAEQDGKLMQGDQILAVNGTDVTNLMQEDVATMLKTCTGRVALKIGRWKLTETANRVHAAAPPSMSSPHTPRNSNNNVMSENNNFNDIGPTPTTPRTGKEEIKENGLKEERKDVPPPAPPSWPQGAMPEVMIQDENQVVVHPDLSPVTEEPGSQNDLKSLGETEPSSTPQPMKEINFIPDWHEEGSDDILIALKKVDGQQWGMGIGKRARGILITSLQPGSTAAEKLKVGDRIMGVNGEKVVDQHSAVTLVKASGNCVVLQVARPINRPSSGNL